MKKILMISYFFPPLTEVGSLRALGFAKHLPKFGWAPHVMTIKNPEKSFEKIDSFKPPSHIKCYYVTSFINLKKITSGSKNLFRKSFKTFFHFSSRRSLLQDLFCIPDIFIGWIIPCFFIGLKIIRKHNIDMIYVSCRPFSSAITALLLKKITRKPLILDFRDPLSFPIDLFDTHVSRHFTLPLIKKIEKYLLQNCNKLILTTNGIRKEYIKRYNFIEQKSHVIYNGYFIDPACVGNAKANPKFTIAYLGNFYHDYHIPSHPFFESLKQIIHNKLVPKDKIQFLYIGNLKSKNNWLDNITQKYSLEGNIITIGSVPRDKALKILYKSSMLLLRIVPPMISTKLFEGLSIGIPILGTFHNTEVDMLLNKYSHKFYIVDPYNRDEISETILDAFRKWNKKELIKKVDPEYLEKFNKKYLAAMLAEIIDDTIKCKTCNC